MTSGSTTARMWRAIPKWQAALREAKLPVLVIWGSPDDFFTTPGALAYFRDAPQAEVIRAICRHQW
jgi:pimeloyl-ACP methyl ester carboxylesterase